MYLLTHSLSPVLLLVVVMKPKEFQTKISHANPLTLSLSVYPWCSCQGPSRGLQSGCFAAVFLSEAIQTDTTVVGVSFKACGWAVYLSRCYALVSLLTLCLTLNSMSHP